MLCSSALPGEFGESGNKGLIAWIQEGTSPG
ncbi:hypothetical protein GDO81_029406 [Engystomops pustulosus]|uniref:Uncharacterized protein n=1 Tax=Engystomops pustulosus TaxID=76066 RepID=A0AAV6YIU8_ENGPU|nr:hypothetical protein GDO81_029406 [Engystomops pustulosus]